MISAIGQVMGPIGKTIQEISEEKWRYVQKYAEHVKTVLDKEKILNAKMGDIDEAVKRGRLKGEDPTQSTKLWLDNVRNLLNDKQLKKLKDLDIEESSERKDKCHCSLGVFREGIFYRYKWSKVAEQFIGKIQANLDQVPPEPTQPLPSHKVQEEIKNYLSHKLKSREDLKDKIVKELLKPDGVHVVGLFGSESVGKTKLAKEIMEDESVKKTFKDKVVMVDVTENPNMKDIQDKIVEVVDPSLKDWETVWLRALLMHFNLRESDKVLIILDNIWRKINMNALLRAASEHCKLLVVSRMKDVCESMDAVEDYIFKMGPLELDEAKHLFWKHIIPDQQHDIEDHETDTVDRVTTGDHLTIGDNLLRNYCRGIPLVIVTIAKMLKDQNLSQWRHFADELDTKRHKFFHSIWTKNFEVLDNTPEKKMFFLLACLFPPQTSIPVQELMRYAMGLDLIQSVNNLTDAMTLANNWVLELISMSLLETDDEKRKAGPLHVKLPRLVRDAAMPLLTTVKHKFMVEAIPRWHTTETCREYTAISLRSGCDHSRLDKFESRKLQMLILDGSKGEIGDEFFKCMKNLRVLVLRDLNGMPHLPESIGELNYLRVLHLEKCHFGATQRPVQLKGLESLVVLSFRDSIMEEFPAYVKGCCKLRLLDLTSCKIDKGIPADVLSSLSELEGLYTCEKFDWANEDQETDKLTESVSSDGSSRTTASITELNKLSYLNVLEMNVRQLQKFPVQGDHFVKNLTQFYISVGDTRNVPSAKRPSRILQFSSISVSSIVQYGCLLALLKKSEMVKLQRIEKLQQFIDDGDIKFPYLNQLVISSCKEMQSFSSKPFNAPNLSELEVVACENLKFFFMEFVQKGEHEFSSLKNMKLKDLEHLESVLRETSCSTTSDDPQGQGHQNQAFFNRKIIFPSLKDLQLESCAIAKLWDVSCKDKQYVDSFKNLKKIYIMHCKKLEVLASLSIAVGLEHLKQLTIIKCQLLRKVVEVTNEDVDDEKLPGTIKQLFPVLDTITIEDCPKLKMFLSGKQNQQVFELSSLVTLKIKECPKMKYFSSETLKAPQLKEVTLDDKPIQQIEDINSFLQFVVQNQRKPSEGSIEGESRGEDQDQDKCVCECKIFI